MSKVKSAYKEIEDIIGSDFITDKDFMKAAYSRNADPAFPDRWADMIIRPETTEEVSAIAKIANKYKIHIVPRGGGADLVGGSVTQGGILLDITRMNHILEINETDFYCEVECGITWGALLSELQKKGLTTGVIGPGSGFSATIGGGLSNSTAGGGSTKYGLVPDICLGVEVVLPNPQGTIIRTGAAANKYARPFCRYGVAPDFTGLFMGDVGTMGIKTKAFLKLFPELPIKTPRNYLLNNNDYNNMYKIVNKLQMEVRDGLYNISILPLEFVKFSETLAQERPPKSVDAKGPVFNIALEAFDQRIIDVYLEKIDEIMKRNDARPFEWQEIDLSRPLSAEYTFNLKDTFNAFHPAISLIPGQQSCTTCHKIPISHLPKVVELADQFELKYKNDYPVQGLSFLAVVIYVLSNGHCVLVGGFYGINTDETRQATMDFWHKKIRFQVKYGAAHYWLGESISQSIVEADAFTPQFVQFFKDMKKAVDPNFLLSPNKFHLYDYEDDISKYIVKDE
ncbi:MAG: FAD-binding oxidoreductase [Candidatus Helarchaeota archaeon]|nr:FAD-binding oxidoreductase [Candidatus Helarchaeota archaeon]